jgi:phosphonate metabolism protein PhnN/1,5-bisphosphokinase (PRPP-forming)
VTTIHGTLILVVGPSGAGKDSLIAGAAQRLGSDPALVFARRVITRPSGSGGEDHFAVTATEFDRLGREGGLMLHWQPIASITACHGSSPRRWRPGAPSSPTCRAR